MAKKDQAHNAKMASEKGLNFDDYKSFVQGHHCNSGCGNVLTSAKKENECLRKGHRTRCNKHKCTFIDFCIQCRADAKRNEHREALERIERLNEKKEEAEKAEVTDFTKATEAQAFRDGTEAVHAYKLLTPNQRKKQDALEEKNRKAREKLEKALERKEAAESKRLQREAQHGREQELLAEQAKRERAQSKGGKRKSDVNLPLSQKPNGYT